MDVSADATTNDSVAQKNLNKKKTYSSCFFMGAQFIYLGLFLACVGGWVGTHGMHIVFVDLEHLYKRLPRFLLGPPALPHFLSIFLSVTSTAYSASEGRFYLTNLCTKLTR